MFERKEGITHFSGIVLRPTLRLGAGGDADKALRILRKSERACLVYASLSTPERLEPVVVLARGSAA
jgi:hypothetical protein